MRIRRSSLLLMIGILPVLCLSLKAGDDAASTDQPRLGPLAVHPQNPRYFQNTATGAVVYLTGSHTWANLVDIGPFDPPPRFDFEKYIGWMARLNHNFMRMWT